MTDERRQIIDHHDGHGLTESIDIYADAAGPGGASHAYDAWMDGTLTSLDGLTSPEKVRVLSVQFQKGPRNEPGSTPGVVESVLLTIVADRLRAFQAGPYACRENALALTKIEEALHWGKARADARAKRGVLGTYQK